jgi:uncharacterized membrane protein
MSEAAASAELSPAKRLAEQRRRHDFDRLLMLSDGVFAIAITLAALEIRPPDGVFGGTHDLLRVLAPALSTYAISFIVIAAYWAGHRRMFSMLQRVDGALVWLNLVLLGLVALQPAGVALLTRLGPRGGALEIYLGLIIAIGLVQSLLWGYAAFAARLVDPAVGLRFRIAQLVLGLALPLISSVLILSSAGSGSAAYMLLAIGLVVAMTLARRAINRRLDR